MIGGELVMVEIMPLGRVLAADIDDGDGGISKILRGRLATDDGHAVDGGEQAAGEEFVLMSAAGMSEDECERHRPDYERGKLAMHAEARL
jgi:hypothetical protein